MFKRYQRQPYERMHARGYIKERLVLSMPIPAGLKIACERLETMANCQPEATSPEWNSQLHR